MNYLAFLFILTGQTFDLPKGLQSAICYQETRHITTSVHKDDGNGDSLGVCQIKLGTAKTLGFTGTAKELQEPKTNIYYSAKYLRHQLDRYNGDPRKAVAAYNAGRHNIDERGLTKNRKYVSAVFKYWSQDK